MKLKLKYSRPEINRFLKYSVGGSIYFWSGYAVFSFLYSGVHWNWFWSKVVCDIVGWSLGYLVQRNWTFADRIHLREMDHAGRYLFIEIIGFCIDYVLIGGLYYAGITPYIGFFISSAFFTVWSYLWYKHWVFPAPKTVSSA